MCKSAIFTEFLISCARIATHCTGALASIMGRHDICKTGSGSA